MNLYPINQYREMKEMTLFIILTFTKISVLHYFMDLDRGLFLVSLQNLLLIFFIYGMVALSSSSRRRKIYWYVNFLLSSLFFIDAMYYSHFYTLVPVHSIYQLGQLGPVSASITSLVKPYYFLFFIDIIGIYMVDRRKEKVPSLKWSKKQRIALGTSVLISLLAVLGLNFRMAEATNGFYTPHSLGVINYHLYDGFNSFRRNTLDIVRAKGVIKQIEQQVVAEASSPKGFRLAQGRNVFVIQAESVQNFVINESINGQQMTPVMNELIQNDSIYFSRYYEQVGWGNTSDAEFISHNGFYPSTKSFSYRAYEENEFITLPSMLKDRGYETIAFHGNDGDFWNRENIYPSQGLDEFISLEDFSEDEMIGIGLSDGEMFRQSLPYLKGRDNPFYSFYITLTSHHPFTMEGLQDQQYEGLNVGAAYEGMVLEAYLETVHYLDYEIGKFIEMLKEADLYENSIIVIHGDHQGLDMRNEEANEQLTDFLNRPYEEKDMFNVPFIVHIPNGGMQEEVTTAGGQIDFFPTMANLLGVETEIQTLGKDLLNITDGFVAKQVHVSRGSFIDNEKIFIMSNDGLFENSRAWMIETGESVDLEACREGYERAIAEIEFSEYVMQNNLIPLIREKGLPYVLQHQP
ncbi:sulfatase [Alkaliphilus metalliredigens QYMF]|uniref:Sulfatase n=1 Tax=Alkaliphilus metalliredigens (strain QYMF) TaxID=293826 RepID=A6TLF4_ALKMQ|nr:LTA synthase family protein [Alkaliphilus metalliredigens]ABR47022.1 sulfatase [Alkaliphilus metalliredigens QYMF]